MTTYKTRVKQDKFTTQWVTECRPTWWYAAYRGLDYAWITCEFYATKREAETARARLQEYLGS